MKAVTFIELLLVIAIFMILAVMTSPFVGSYLIRSNRRVAVDRVMSQIWKAQAYAMNGKVINGNKVWGVCLVGNTLRTFNGDCVSPNFKEDYAMPTGVSISGIGSVVFDGLTGAPSSLMTITIANNLGSGTISVNGVGMVQEN